MAKKVIEVDVQTNIPGTINELKQLKKELKNAAAGSEDFKRLYNEIDDLEEKIKGTKKASSDWVDSLAAAPGPLGMVGRAINGAKEATTSFSGALKATGIGLIVMALGGMVAAFSQNENAMKKIQPLLNGLQKILGGIFRAMEPLLDAFLDLAMKALPYVTQGIGIFYSSLVGLFTLVKEAGSGYIKMMKGIVTLDFDAAKEGFNQMKDSFSKAVKSGEEAYKRFESGSKEQTKSEKESAEERKKIADDEAEKKKAAGEKSAAAKKVAREKEAAALKKEKDDAEAHANEMAGIEQGLLNDIENINAKSDQEKLDLQATRELNAIMAKKKAGDDVTGIMKLYNEKYTKLDAELQEKLKKQADDKAVKDKEIADKNANELRGMMEQYYTGVKSYKDAENEAEIEQVRAHQQALLDEQEKAALEKATKAGASAEELQKIKDYYNQQEVKNGEAATAAKVTLGELEVKARVEQAQRLGALLSSVSDLIGKDTAAGKVAAVAATTINTYAAAQAAFLNAQKNPISIIGPAYPYISAGLAIAGGLKNVQSILSVKTPGGGGGAAAPSGGGMGAGPAAPAFNVVGNSGVNQIAQTITEGNKNTPPIQTYVVAKDVTSAQGLDRNIIDNASLG